MRVYLKAIVAFVGACAEALLVYVDDNAITSDEWPLIVAGIATLIGVYFFPNKSDKKSRY